MVLTYSVSANDRQPHGSYRIDVYSQKAGRRMTLYGKAALCQFIDLEVDFEVTDVCERPLVMPNAKPTRVVDFWAVCGGVATFYILVRPSENDDHDTKGSAYELFGKWATDNGARVREVNLADFEKRRVRYDNWSLILQHLIAHQGQISNHLLDRCGDVIPQTATLCDFENDIADVDAMLVRAGVFTLLARGNLKCDSIDTVPLNSKTKVARV